jgi:hypothetical protein
MTWDRRLYFLSKGRCAEDFFTLKIRWLRPGANPRTWVPKASKLPLDHRSRYHVNYITRVQIALACISYSSSMYQLAWEMFFSSGCCGTAVTSGKWWLHNFVWICHCSCEIICFYCFRITIFMKIENYFFKYVICIFRAIL